MKIDLEKVLDTYKKTYKFCVKIASDAKLNDKDLVRLKSILTLKGMTKCSEPEKLPLTACVLEFKRLEGFVGNIFKIDMEFEYPITPIMLIDEVSTTMNLGRAFISVRTFNDPYEEFQMDYNNYSNEDYLSLLVNDEIMSDIDPNDYYGDEYNKELVKALQTPEAKKYQKGFVEVKTKDEK